MFLYLYICSVYLSSFTLGLFVWVQTRDWLSPISLIHLVWFYMCFHSWCVCLLIRVQCYHCCQETIVVPILSNTGKTTNVQVIRARWVRLKYAGLSIQATEKWTTSNTLPLTGKNVWNLVKCSFLLIHLWGILCLPSFLFNNARMPLMMLSWHEHVIFIPLGVWNVFRLHTNSSLQLTTLFRCTLEVLCWFEFCLGQCKYSKSLTI